VRTMPQKEKTLKSKFQHAKAVFHSCLGRDPITLVPTTIIKP
jgi:hypothetical protein